MKLSGTFLGRPPARYLSCLSRGAGLQFPLAVAVTVATTWRAAGLRAYKAARLLVATTTAISAGHGLAAATTLTTNSKPSPLIVNAGTAIAPVIFSTAGAPTQPGSWELLGGSTLPPGLSFGIAGSPVRLTAPGIVDASAPTLEGTPTVVGTYTLRLIAWELPGRGGLDSDIFTYTVMVAAANATIAPTITLQPVSQTVGQGANVTLSVQASGLPAPSYQWRKSGINMLGQTRNTLLLGDVTIVDSGGYSVVVSNSAGSVTSSTATLTVLPSPLATLPVITTQPISQSVGRGSTVMFTVVATGMPEPTYQWRKSGFNLSGQTSSILTLNDVTVIDNGNYTVVASNSAGDVTSAVATLTVTTAPPTPTLTTQPQSITVLPGATAVLAVSGTNIATYQWRRNGINVLSANQATLILDNVSALDAGTYTVVVANGTNNVTSNPATVTVASAATLDSQLVNLSVRTPLAVNQTVIVGFVTSGLKTLLVRGVGPTLQTLAGITNFYEDPRLTLFNQGGAEINSNDNWNFNLDATFTRLGAFPLINGSRDAALLQDVVGPVTAHVRGPGAGIVLVEVYDADTTLTAATLKNVSARSQVGTGENILIGGFVIRGAVAKTLLIRGIGPALADFSGVAGTLPDPQLAIYTQTGAKVAENDNWNPSLEARFATLGASPFKAASRDAAILISLPPGAYTAQVSGLGPIVTGEGMVEVYVVP